MVTDRERIENTRYKNEFEARSRAMPFHRLVAPGEALPREIGNVDKMLTPDGSGTMYMFPTQEALDKCFNDTPEDPRLGQEAQGGPLHGDTGRGEKYAGGNVETEVVAESFKDGDDGIQRHVPGDGAAIGGAVEDADVDNTPNQHPDQKPGKDAAKKKGGVKISVSKTKAGGAAVTDTEVAGDGTADTSAANEMKEGEKTATDEAAEGAVTAGNSKSDIEEASPGVEASDGGKSAPDQSEGTAKDTADPTADGSDKDDTGGDELAKQKSDEATPQTPPPVDGNKPAGK
jgi:hypothetical protein